MQGTAWLKGNCAQELNDVSIEKIVEARRVLYSQISENSVSRSVEVNAGVDSTYTRPLQSG